MQADRSTQWLEARRRETQVRRDAAARRESLWSWARLGTFLVAVSLWYPLLPVPAAALLVTVAGMAGFVWSVRIHLQAKAAREALDRELLVIDETAQRFGGKVVVIRSGARPPREGQATASSRPGASRTPRADSRAKPVPTAFADDVGAVLPAGQTWRLTHQELDDLDVYGDSSLFGLLNRTSTPVGEARLSDMLENLQLAPGDILERQTAVRWLEEHPEERLRLLAAAAALRNEDRGLYRLIEGVRAAAAPLSSDTSLLLRIWSAFSTLIAAFTMAGLSVGHLSALWGLILLLLVNAAVQRSFRQKLRQALAPWQDTLLAVRGVLQIARQTANDLPAETQLGLIRTPLSAAAEGDVLPALLRRVGWTEHGGPVHEFFNLTSYLDLHLVETIHRHVLPHREALLAAMAALADLEALLCLGCFAWEQPIRAWPVLAAEPRLEIRAGRHMLIHPDKAVPNDVQLDPTRRVWIITGSNMSGKSTFLRMTGMNIVLAQIGAPVVADAMTLSALRLITDLRARDDMSRAESYFLAEVRQLRRMIDPSPGPPVVGLIDEPLRGTNSEEQVAASVAVLEHLASSGHLFLLATHDQKLTEIVMDGIIQNYHFQEDLGSAGLVFDYRLRDGPAHTRNALRVLEQEGYPPQLVSRARAWLSE